MRPQPTLVMHFTHIEHLDTIITDGLLRDPVARGGLLKREAGNPGIKAARRKRKVPIHPFGHVGDYVPFYFAARSPTMFAISHGRVPEFGRDVTALMYLGPRRKPWSRRGSRCYARTATRDWIWLSSDLRQTATTWWTGIS